MQRRHLLSVVAAILVVTAAFTQSGPAEAPTGFDDQTNGFVDQTQFDLDKDTFEERDTIADGLGPVYNAQSCAECHQNPVTGAISQVTELRAGHFDGVNFIDHPGGSLINDRAIDASIQERVLGGNEVRTFRTSLNTAGDGFVECIDSNTLAAIANAQPGQSGGAIAGLFQQVPGLEAPGNNRGARFGWKNQHASRLSFSSGAYTVPAALGNKVVHPFGDFLLHTV